MCMIDCCDEFVQTLRTSDPVAKKEHSCNECGRGIAAGEKYHVDVHVFKGEVISHKTCRHCMVVRLWLLEICGGWVYTCIWEDIIEHNNWSVYGSTPGRLAVGMKRDWQDWNGNLMPVPTLPDELVRSLD